MYEIQIKVGERILTVAVDSSEEESAAAAAELLQLAVDDVTKNNPSSGPVSDYLLLAGMRVADQLAEANVESATALNVSSGTENSLNPPAESPTGQTDDEEVLRSLERIARRVERFADQLENVMAIERGPPREAL